MIGFLRRWWRHRRELVEATVIVSFASPCRQCRCDHTILSLAKQTRVPRMLRRGHDYAMPPTLGRLVESGVFVSRTITSLMLDEDGYRTYQFEPLRFFRGRHGTETVALALTLFREAGWTLDDWCAEWEKHLEGEGFHDA